MDGHATVDIAAQQITVRFQKRAPNPLLLHADFDKKSVQVPGMENRPLQLVFGS